MASHLRESSEILARRQSKLPHGSHGFRIQTLESCQLSMENLSLTDHGPQDIARLENQAADGITGR